MLKASRSHLTTCSDTETSIEHEHTDIYLLSFESIAKQELLKYSKILFKPYSLHVDICLAVANGRNFALGLQSGELSVSLLVRS